MALALGYVGQRLRHQRGSPRMRALEDRSRSKVAIAEAIGTNGLVAFTQSSPTRKRGRKRRCVNVTDVAGAVGEGGVGVIVAVVA